jgi:hypothetical protein
MDRRPFRWKSRHHDVPLKCWRRPPVGCSEDSIWEWFFGELLLPIGVGGVVVTCDWHGSRSAKVIARDE